MRGTVSVGVLPDAGDERGRSWQLAEGLAFLEAVRDVHFTTVEPGHSRGHHFHRDRREVLVVEHEDGWRLLWDEGEGQETQVRSFEGSGAVMVRVGPGCAHAVENTGGRALRVLSMGDAAYDPEDPDVEPRRLEAPE